MNSHTAVGDEGLRLLPVTVIDRSERRPYEASLWAYNDDMLHAEIGFLVAVAGGWVADHDTHTAGLIISTVDDVDVAVHLSGDAGGDVEVQVGISTSTDPEDRDRAGLIDAAVDAWVHRYNGADCDGSRFVIGTDAESGDLTRVVAAVVELLYAVLADVPPGSCLVGMWLSPDEDTFLDVQLNRFRMEQLDSWVTNAPSSGVSS